jgi:hypothetical protein
MLQSGSDCYLVTKISGERYDPNPYILLLDVPKDRQRGITAPVVDKEKLAADAIQVRKRVSKPRMGYANYGLFVVAGDHNRQQNAIELPQQS